jgi:OOP family OmpA-OmpF porin
MSNRPAWSRTAFLLVALAAACAPPARNSASSDDGGDRQPAANAAAASNASEVDEERRPRSILRADVAAPAPAPPRIEPAHAVIGFGASPFALDDAGRAAIDALLDAPATRSGGAIVLRGHSDSRGSDGDNRAASRVRAEQVRDYLVAKGVAPGRITIIALGETRPVAPNARRDGSDDPEGRAANRRVEIDVAVAEPDDDAGAPAATATATADAGS